MTRSFITPTAFVVRTATLADAETIADIHVSSWRASVRHLLSPQRLTVVSETASERHWRHLIGDRSSPVWVACHGALILGVAHATASRDADRDPTRTGEVTAIYVRPIHHGQGVGRFLLLHALEHLARQGLTDASLWIVAINAVGRRFVESQGFVDEGHHRLEPQKDLDEVRYVRVITDLRPWS